MYYGPCVSHGKRRFWGWTFQWKFALQIVVRPLKTVWWLLVSNRVVANDDFLVLPPWLTRQQSADVTSADVMTSGVKWVWLLFDWRCSFAAIMAHDVTVELHYTTLQGSVLDFLSCFISLNATGATRLIIVFRFFKTTLMVASGSDTVQ